MGIKDNFSQAVKELWKKDSSDKKDSSKPSELEQYLRQSDEEKGGSTAMGIEFNKEGVPLETPYYRKTPAPEPAKPAEPQQAEQAPASKPAPAPAPTQRAAEPAPAQQEEPVPPPINRNVQNARTASAGGTDNRQNAAQNSGAMPAGDRFDQGAQNNGRNFAQNNQGGFDNRGGYNDGYGGQGNYGGYNDGYGGQGGNFGGYGGNPPQGGAPMPNQNENEELTVISKNTMIDGNVRSLANMQIDGNIKGNVETTRNIDMSGKIIGDVTCNNAGMASAAMQGNISLKGRMRMDRDTILIGDLSSQYADINGRVRGKLDIVGKAELKRDAVVFGDINASTIAVTDGAIIQGYVNTTFLSKEDSRNVFPDAISIDSKEVNS